jgi:hypothetical protein
MFIQQTKEIFEKGYFNQIYVKERLTTWWKWMFIIFAMYKIVRFQSFIALALLKSSPHHIWMKFTGSPRSYE